MSMHDRLLQPGFNLDREQPHQPQSHSIIVTSVKGPRQAQKSQSMVLYSKLSRSVPQDLQWQKCQSMSNSQISSNIHQPHQFQTMQEMEENPIQPQHRSISFNMKNKNNLHSSFRQHNGLPERLSMRIFPNPKPAQLLLNHRIFHLPHPLQLRLYSFNLILNILIRLGVIAVLALLIRQKRYAQAQVIIGGYLITSMVYGIAMVKILYTRSDKEAVYCQKMFHAKEYADIHMDRMFRKNFTLKLITNNICTYLSPNSIFSKSVKVSLLKQQIFKRVQLVMVIIPLMVMFLVWSQRFTLGLLWGKLFVMSLLIASVLQTALHYLIIYCYS